MPPTLCAATHPPPLQDLKLEQVQGGGSMLAPLAGMPAMRGLDLSACHLNDGLALQAALQAATGLTSLRVQVLLALVRGAAPVLRRAVHAGRQQRHLDRHTCPSPPCPPSPICKTLLPQSCGIQSEVLGAVVAALPALPDLRELVLGLRRAPPRATGEPLVVTGQPVCGSLREPGRP